MLSWWCGPGIGGRGQDKRGWLDWRLVLEGYDECFGLPQLRDHASVIIRLHQTVLIILFACRKEGKGVSPLKHAPWRTTFVPYAT